MAEKITRNEILQNRRKWIDRLIRPESKKATGALRSIYDDDAMCCLGHGCEAMGLKWDFYGSEWFCHNSAWSSPCEFKHAVGLLTNHGGVRTGGPISIDNVGSESSLARINDRTKAKPQEIGKYLESVIDGGAGTPFRPLSDYPEVIS